MKKTAKKWPFVLLFLLGFLIMLYPVVSNFYYQMQAMEEIAAFNQGISRLSEQEIFERMELARAYNRTLDPSRLADPYTDIEKEGIAAYARMLEVEEKLGHVEIPAIKVDLPIYAGTSQSVLERGAGHLEGTSLPIGGDSTHTVITAHRGLPKAKMFRNLNKVKKGDIFYIHNIETVLAYQVDHVEVVEPWDFKPILVEPGQDYATLLTCTPYMINSHRYLVRGHRIPYVPPVAEDDLSPFGLDLSYKDYLMFLVPTVIVLSALAVYNGREMQKAKKRLKDYEAKRKS
ncbi:Sortase (surface protein transpeptidase) [Aedoeadaptatus ivorii]|uniref:Sortase (Surface protein transpeptidase) n=1 Tax=Aedoeadaptatus ivorii TaxID=54006 RepID=A0A448UZN3_9FIRM|nr:class C sortase [Peptoniphilus ivorii]VEJ34491.1 Sortase (surface protein transpeptidase) [Peptoniphilus ivorii]